MLLTIKGILRKQILFTVNPVQSGHGGEGSWVLLCASSDLGEIVIKMARPGEIAGGTAESTAPLCPRVVH